MGKEALAWAILLLPLFAAGIIALFTRKFPAASARISIVAVVASFFLTWAFAGAWNPETRFETTIDWVTVGNFNVQMGVAIDRLAWIMLLVVTGVGSAIHIYSFGYMHDDPSFSRFFA